MNENILERINNIDLVINLIEALKDRFVEIRLKYEPNEHTNVENYYMTGHCSSFAKILYFIFENYTTIYDSKYEGHVISKIGDHYYDIRGLIDNLVDLKTYQECPIDYLPYIENIYLNTSNYEQNVKIEQEMINTGKQILQKMLDYNYYQEVAKK